MSSARKRALGGFHLAEGRRFSGTWRKLRATGVASRAARCRGMRAGARRPRGRPRPAPRSAARRPRPGGRPAVRRATAGPTAGAPSPGRSGRGAARAGGGRVVDGGRVGTGRRAGLLVGLLQTEGVVPQVALELGGVRADEAGHVDRIAPDAQGGGQAGHRHAPGLGRLDALRGGQGQVGEGVVPSVDVQAKTRAAAPASSMPSTPSRSSYQGSIPAQRRPLRRRPSTAAPEAQDGVPCPLAVRSSPRASRSTLSPNGKALARGSALEDVRSHAAPVPARRPRTRTYIRKRLSIRLPTAAVGTARCGRCWRRGWRGVPPAGHRPYPCRRRSSTALWASPPYCTRLR